MRLALFQPDIPQNVGAAMRLSACFGIPLEIIEPCAFPVSDRSLKRAALDYGPAAQIIRHDSWEHFLQDPARRVGRLLLFTTRGAERMDRFRFEAGDTLLMGQESCGAPDHVHAASEARVFIPIRSSTRSLNLSVAAGIALYAALGQTGQLPGVSGEQDGPDR
jgi:tRNA (cytidine/uridine-2'-O-)-methyltransferase